MPNWCWNQVEVRTRDEAEFVKEFLEARLDRPQVQGIGGSDGKWNYTVETRWNIAEDEIQELVEQRTDLEFVMYFSDDGSGTVGSIYAPGDGTAWIVAEYEPDFGDDDAARDAWWADDERDARRSSRRERFV
ncbi:hypothetical protein [Adlercreutzia sp. ZJ138]|uniref:hypothetical protein n=1 Tax=Adlercreutzia sp. ZJ138 TaxID=2709405 RepID=UPI0013EBDF86|nr:hypothetical protein [Adlercreutzia sp. ZJ138]